MAFSWLGTAYNCSNITEVANILQGFASRSASDAVYNVYMVPNAIINDTDQTLEYSGQTSPVTLTTSFTKINNVNGYVPRNNKLLTFPYQYLLISNNNGSSNILHFERFSGSTCNFNIKGVPVVGGSVKLTPSNYDGVDNQENGLIGGKFPTLNWSKDEYTNWLTQNSVNIGLGVASGALTIVGGLASANPIGGVGGMIGGSMQIANVVGSIYEHSLQPNSAKGNVNGGDINVCDNKNGFYFYKMSIKAEYARIIDDYFSMFGYKTNRVKVPNITGRSKWNYVKTIDCNFDGDIPDSDLMIIRTMFNNGVTLWHDPSKIYDYSQTNSIVT